MDCKVKDKGRKEVAVGQMQETTSKNSRHEAHFAVMPALTTSLSTPRDQRNWAGHLRNSFDYGDVTRMLIGR